MKAGVFSVIGHFVVFTCLQASADEHHLFAEKCFPLSQMMRGMKGVVPSLHPSLTFPFCLVSSSLYLQLRSFPRPEVHKE